MIARAGRTNQGIDPFSTLRDWLLFAREAFANPREIGAVIPSSPALARRMAERIEPSVPGFIVELGAGTGVVTEALLERGVSVNRLVALELSPSLVARLRERFPALQILCGDAADLRRILRRAGVDTSAGPVHVVSSLPLRSLPAAKVASIVREVGLLVRPAGTWVQYTYALAHRRIPAGFVRERSSVVWGNIPPARVDVLAPLASTSVKKRRS